MKELDELIVANITGRQFSPALKLARARRIFQQVIGFRKVDIAFSWLDVRYRIYEVKLHRAQHQWGIVRKIVAYALAFSSLVLLYISTYRAHRISRRQFEGPIDADQNELIADVLVTMPLTRRYCLALAESKYEKAAYLFESKVNKEDFIRAMTKRGDVLLEQERPEQAAVVLQKAVNSNSDGVSDIVQIELLMSAADAQVALDKGDGRLTKALDTLLIAAVLAQRLQPIDIDLIETIDDSIEQVQGWLADDPLQKAADELGATLD